ncbi:RNA 2',3'-cyclic phosphodiesterase [Candidatus Nitrospira bockiana]
MIRAFIAVELDEPLRTAIARVQASLKRELGAASREARIQWVRPEAVHVTLKFLGDVDEPRIQPVATALSEALSRKAAFALEVGGYGVFPDAREPRVLWVGLSGEVSRLVGLAQEVERAVVPLGFDAERKPFTPHLTLARIKDGARQTGRALTDLGILKTASPIGRLDISMVSLMKSELKPSGSVYTRLASIPLVSEGREGD